MAGALAKGAVGGRGTASGLTVTAPDAPVRVLALTSRSRAAQVSSAVRGGETERESHVADQLSRDPRFASGPSRVSPEPGHGDGDGHHVPRHDRTAEPGPADACQTGEHARRLRPREHQHRPHLGDGLQDEDAGHDGAAREMPPEKRLAVRDAFPPDHTLPRLDLQDPVHQEEGVAVRQDAGNVLRRQAD
jgi:hypothetical protein